MTLSGGSIKLLFVILNFILLLFALALVIVGINNILDHGLILEITSGSIYLTGTYLLIFVGFILCFTVCVGTYGSLKEDRFMLIAFVVLLVILFIFGLIGGILVLAFPSSVNESTKAEMKRTLINQYGRIRLITDAWNLTQNRLRCCGVEDRQWDIYMNSYWDNITNIDLNNMNLKISRHNPFYRFVPISCCWLLVDPQTGWPGNVYRSVNYCQNFQFGPPNRANGAQNDALYYRGCANAMKSYLKLYADGIGGLAIFLIFLFIAGIILAIVELRYIQRKDQHDKERSAPTASSFGRSQNYPPEEKEPQEQFNPSDSETSEFI